MTLYKAPTSVSGPPGGPPYDAPNRLGALLLTGLTAAAWMAPPASAATSTLWGEAGEAFDPTGRLMDWSYAGYHSSEAPLPDPSGTHSIVDYGAVANDDVEDTAAIQAALAAAEGGGVVVLPAGTFIVRGKLTLTSGVVLRGAGSEQTVVDVPVSLTDVFGNSGLAGGGTSSYAFSGGFIEAKGAPDGPELATVTQDAVRVAPPTDHRARAEDRARVGSPRGDCDRRRR